MSRGLSRVSHLSKFFMHDQFPTFLSYFILLLLLIDCSTALRWPKLTQLSADAPAVDSSLTLISIDQLDAIFSSRDLVRYADKPDCHKHAAIQIHAQCEARGNTHELERRIAAVRMTLCDITTNAPLECASFSEPGSTLSANNLDRCVDALLRSTQHWTSYSGYLRDMPQLCHILRSGADIDTASAIYANATRESIEYFHLLKEYHKHSRDTFKDGAQIIEDITNELRSAHMTNEDAHTKRAESLQNAFLELLAEHSSNTSKGLDIIVTSHANELNAALATVAKKLVQMLGEGTTQYQSGLVLADAFRKSMTRLASNMEAMDTMLRSSQNRANDLHVIIKGSVDKSAALSMTLDVLHSKSIATTDLLLEHGQASITALNNTAYEAQHLAQSSIEALNRTVYEVQQEWKRNNHQRLWSWDVLAWILRVDISAFARFSPAVLSTLSALFAVLQFIFITSAQAAAIVFVCSRWIFRQYSKVSYTDPEKHSFAQGDDYKPLFQQNIYWNIQHIYPQSTLPSTNITSAITSDSTLESTHSSSSYV